MPADDFEDARRLLAQGMASEAAEAFERAVAAAPDQARQASAAGRLLQRASQPALAQRFYALAQRHDPRDAEHPHDRGIALLELGEVGAAAQAQALALALDPEHTGARAQRAAALEALGDDEGAARELDQLLRRIGPHLPLQARLQNLRDLARRAAGQRLLGQPAQRLQSSRLIGHVFSRAGEQHRAQFGSLRTALDTGGRIAALELLFDDMDASLQRSDLAYGGTTEDEHGRRVPLDEFTSAATVFLSEALGVEPLRTRRILRWLLTAEAGRGPHRLAGALVGWLIDEAEGRRRYGLSVAAAPELV